MESWQYRGCQIEAWQQWSSWCVGVYRTHSDLPILPQPTWHTLSPRKDDAVAEAKQSIDRTLSKTPEEKLRWAVSTLRRIETTAARPVLT